MRFLYLAMLILFLSTSLFAQIEIAPLTANPVLKAHQEKLGKHRSEDLLYTRMMANNCPDPTQVDTIFGESTTIYVVSGDSVLICIDQLAFTIIDSAECLNCDGLLFGNVSYNPANFCFTYTANPGIIAETGDTMLVEVTDLNEQMELEFPIVVKRANQTITMPAVTVSTESAIDLCVGAINLPGSDRDFAIQDCNNPLYSQLTSADSCITYTTQRFAEQDEVCIEVCDEFCVCDTYVFPITIEGSTLSFPFFDDFSNDGPFPDKNLWLDDNVYINSHFPYQPPSYGVATFDGLDQNGSPYGGSGAADYLTSGYFDLEGMDQSDNIYLTYFIQPKGLANFFPGTVDSLVLQFRTDTSGWETIVSYEGLLGSTSPLARIPFDPIKIHHIRESRFLHDQFQFRFINHCKRLGMQYLWHLDYVRVNINEVPDGFFEDAAFTGEPSSFLETYRHMPIHQFLENENAELADTVTIAVYNSGEFTRNITPSNLSITDCESGNQLFFNSTILRFQTISSDSLRTDSIPDPNEPGKKILDTLFYFVTLPKGEVDTIYNGPDTILNQLNLVSQAHECYINPIDYSNLNIPNTGDPIILETAYSLDVGEQLEAVYPSVARNDTVRTKTYLTDFFAYDDGSPEALISGNNEGTQLATQFHANIADELVGVQFNFPHTGNTLNAEFVVKVWLDDLGNDTIPIYTSPPFSVLYPDLYYDSLYGFTTYRFQDAALENIKVPIPAGTFFVGIEQTSEGRIGLGFDINSPNAVNFQWFKGSTFMAEWKTIIQPGAMMVRPLVGEFPLFTETEEPRIEPETLQVNLYPNPAQNILHLPVNQAETNDLEIQIISSTGQVLLYRAWEPTLDLNNWINGLYFIQIVDRKTGAQVKDKFLILR